MNHRTRGAVRSDGAEREQFGIDHCEAGRLLIQKWNLPAEFCAVAGYDGDYPADEPFGLPALVRIACGLATSLGFHVLESPGAPGFEEVLQLLPERVRHKFTPNPDDLREIILSKLDSFDMPGLGESPGVMANRGAAPLAKRAEVVPVSEPEPQVSPSETEAPAPAALSPDEPESPMESRRQ
jgi:hypothetical protein